MISSEVRECLKLDPDHKQCYSHYKQVKKLNKQIQAAEEYIQEQRCVCMFMTTFFMSTSLNWILRNNVVLVHL